MQKNKSLKYLIFLVIIIFSARITTTYFVQRVDVHGDSMEPVMSDGEVYLMEKLTYRMHEPKRFDLIVFRYIYDDDSYYIKRVIGLPGETVQIIDGIIYIDGKLLEDPYGDYIEKPKRAADPVLLGDDEYFVLGDNRGSSSDSRDSDVGNVKKNQILGKVWIKIWQKQ
ncbi:signal peptidase I [Clostridium sp. MCC353]|uniref:signal peptidase I n=1 Tax=Clostridium sp. MCC353 TaxID=2592646 RepID=UPI001C03902D|nr:signal peptidase I [Clostridium sp. MCC353]MBT9775809.1 signal peptidase I [Clostridium sp. MCC353]